MAFILRWTLLNKILREVLERLGAAFLEDGAYDDFVKEGAPRVGPWRLPTPHGGRARVGVGPRGSTGFEARREAGPWTTSTGSAGVRQNGAIQLESSVNGTMT